MTGRYTKKRLPRPTVLSASMKPPWLIKIFCTTDSPSPVPSPAALVVKNGSKIRESISGGIPQPVSDTSSRTNSPSATGWYCSGSWSWKTRRVATVSVPPVDSMA